MENLASKYKEIAAQNEKIINSKEQRAAEKDLPLFLKAALKKIEKAASKGDTFTIYCGKGAGWLANWNYRAIRLLEEKLMSLGFDCRPVSSYVEGIVIYWSK